MKKKIRLGVQRVAGFVKHNAAKATGTVAAVGFSLVTMRAEGSGITADTSVIDTAVSTGTGIANNVTTALLALFGLGIALFFVKKAKRSAS